MPKIKKHALLPIFTVTFYVALVATIAIVFPLKEIILDLNKYGGLTPLLFILLFFIGGFLYFPNGIFFLASAIIFPAYIGAIYYAIAVFISASTSFYVGTLLFEKNIFPKLHKKVLESDIRKKIELYGYKAIFVSQLLGLSFDLPNYAAGYVKLKYSKFILVVLLTNLPLVLIYHTLVHFTDLGSIISIV